MICHSKRLRLRLKHTNKCGTLTHTHRDSELNGPKHTTNELNEGEDEDEDEGAKDDEIKQSMRIDLTENGLVICSMQEKKKIKHTHIYEHNPSSLSRFAIFRIEILSISFISFDFRLILNNNGRYTSIF